MAEKPIILISDDDENLRYLMREALENEGFVVVEASDGGAALQLAQTMKPDLVLLDVRMPVIDGFEVCSRIRNDPKLMFCPVLIATGLDDTASIERAYRAGATSFVVKPINWQTLPYDVRYILRNSNNEAELRSYVAALEIAKRDLEEGSKQLEEQKQELQLLARITEKSNQTTSAAEVLKFAVEEVCAFCGWEVGHSYLTFGPKDNLYLRSTSMWHAHDSARVAEFQRSTEEMIFPAGIGLPGRVLATGKAAWIPDVREGNNFLRQSLAAKCGLKGAIAFPVFSGSEVVAVLEFFSSTPRQQNLGFLELMSQIGLQLGRVIERRRAHDALRDWTMELTRARDAAEAADRAKSAFLTTMSHELRTPLNAILGFSEIIKSEMLGPINHQQYKDYIQSIFSSGTHLLALIDDVLDISQLKDGRLALEIKRVDITELLRDCLAIIEMQANEAKIRVTLDLDGYDHQSNADPKRVKQILLNLLSNAIKFTCKGGDVRISTASRNGMVAITVTDTGIGISNVPLALEPFGQIDSRLSRQYEGAGLGLPLAKHLIELHGGSLTIESRQGIGSMVTVLLPELQKSDTSKAMARVQQ